MLNKLRHQVSSYGVIGNTAGFGPVVLGSSPSRPTRKALDFIEVRGFLVSWERETNFLQLKFKNYSLILPFCKN